MREIAFLRSVGLTVHLTEDEADSFIPGVWLDGDALFVNQARVKHRSDIYHEAGHLAVIPSAFRVTLPRAYRFEEKEDCPWSKSVFAYLNRAPLVGTEDGGFREDPVLRGLLQMSETEAIAWSYAAMIAAGDDARACFHEPDSFDGDGASVYSMLANRCYLGINGLQAAGFTSVRTFPAMNRWLQV